MNAILDGYARNAPELIRRWSTLSVAEILAPVADMLPTCPVQVIDIGAGPGDTAEWLAKQRHSVLAVEPVAAFRTAGSARCPRDRVRWLDDTLPDLTRVIGTFDLALLIGVWQHLTSAERCVAMARFATLLSPGGRLVMSVRHGPGAADRPCYEATTQEVVSLANAAGLREIRRQTTGALQPANQAANVSWTWLVLER